MSQEPDPLDSTPRALRILVPLDRSRLAEVALAYLTHLPLSGGEITLLHVLPEFNPFIPELADDSLQETVAAELEERAAPLRNEGRAVSVKIVTGDPGEAIIDASEGYDLVVMTTHGRGAAGRIIFGSVTDRVTRHGTVPTLILRAGHDDAEVPPPTRIVLPLDRSELAERAVPVAARLATAMHLPVALVHAVDLDAVRAAIHDARTHEAASAEAGVSFDAARQQAQETARTYLETVRQRLAEAGLEATAEVLEGTVTFALLEEVAPTDLVVMTSPGRHGFRRWLLGSVAEKLVRESAGPLLLIPTRER